MRFIFFAVFLSFALITPDAQAGMLARLFHKNSSDSSANAAIPANVRVIKDVAYGNDERETMDVYTPPNAQGAPVLFMVHGGGWRLGNKAAAGVVNNKVAHWVSKGFIFISVNYPMLPDTDPIKQADEVRLAIASAQVKAASWGGDPAKFILMGHSAGAHIVALISATPGKAVSANVQPWLGSVLLDSAALDVPDIMQNDPPRLYVSAFGKDPAYWQAASPVNVMNAKTFPMLAVCSSQRKTSCPHAHAFVEKASGFGTKASVLEEDFTHGEINEKLGADVNYTHAVDLFLASLDASVRDRLITTSR